MPKLGRLSLLRKASGNLGQLGLRGGECKFVAFCRWKPQDRGAMDLHSKGFLSGILVFSLPI